jgi:hypothetical protein
VSVFYAPKAVDAAKRLEESARKGKLELCGSHAIELRDAVSNLLTSLGQFLTPPSTKAA